MFDYPDGPFDAERNTDEFVAAMPSWRSAGLLAFTLNFQGGSPQGYSSEQPWHNSAFAADGRLRPDYAARMGRIIERADELGMVVILGCFYFGQDQRLSDEAAVVAAAEERDRVGRGRRLHQCDRRDRQRDRRAALHAPDPETRPRPRADRDGPASLGGSRRQSGRDGCWSAPATAAARFPGPTSSAWRTSSFSTATISTTRPRSA